MNLDMLLESKGEDAPSGEDLEYDLIFTEMELAAQPGEERQAGDEIIAAEDPDFKEVTEKALAVMEKSHDLRAGAYLAYADLRQKGLPGFADATYYIRKCLEDFWDSCHPQLDADDDNDPTMRVNSVLALADQSTILRGLRLAPLTESRTFGRLSLRDIAVAEGERAAPADMENVPDSAAVAAAFQDTDKDHLQGLFDAAQAALDNVKAISAKFEEEVPGQGPDLDPLAKDLKKVIARIGGAAGLSGSATAAPDGEVVQEAPVSGGAAPVGAIGGINSVNDVHNALDRIIAYYQRAEPSSPLPLLLLRAKRLVGMDFMTIMKDMAPSGIENVNVIGGLENDEFD